MEYQPCKSAPPGTQDQHLEIFYPNGVKLKVSGVDHHYKYAPKNKEGILIGELPERVIDKGIPPT